MMDLPQAGGQSVLIGLLFYAIRWIDRKSFAPKSSREDINGRFGEIEAKIERIGRNKCNDSRVDSLEEQYEGRFSRIEYKLGIKRGI
jgi:hypothetical protein